MNDLLTKIIVKANEINSRKKNTIFLYYSGHVKLLNIQIHKNGWTSEGLPDVDKRVYLDERNCKKELQKILEILKKLEK